jgi:hypothetical protein
MSSLCHAPREIAKVDHLLRRGVRSSDFRLARAEGGAFLSLAKPTERPPILENDAAIHALRNLKSGRRVPSATELPSWETQHASLYAERVLEEPRDGGIASLYASTLEDGG